jgi:hypothetical protein
MFSLNTSESSRYDESDCDTIDSSRNAIVQCTSLDQSLKSPILDILDILHAAENDLEQLQYINISCTRMVKVKQSRYPTWTWDLHALEMRIEWAIKVAELIYRIENLVNSLERNHQYQELYVLMEYENDDAAVKQRKAEIIEFIGDDPFLEPQFHSPATVEISDYARAKTSELQNFSAATRNEHHGMRIRLDMLRERVDSHVDRCIEFSRLKAEVEQSKMAADKQYLIRNLFINIFRQHQAYSSRLHIQDMWQTRLNFSRE